jgi:hypothetical protein
MDENSRGKYWFIHTTGMNVAFAQQSGQFLEAGLNQELNKTTSKIFLSTSWTRFSLSSH